MSKKPTKVHPNSLDNLIKKKAPLITSETAREMQARSVEARNANKERRAAIQQMMTDFAALKMDMPPAVDILRIQLSQAIAVGDDDEISRLAALVAPYETPKLASKEVNITENLSEKTDDEILETAKELGIDIEKLN